MTTEDSEEVALLVAEVFGSSLEVNDELLSPEIRSLFYALESQRILSFRREEYTNEEGVVLRAFYWRIRTEEISPPRSSIEAPSPTIYDSLPAEIWSRSSPL